MPADPIASEMGKPRHLPVEVALRDRLAVKVQYPNILLMGCSL